MGVTDVWGGGNGDFGGGNWSSEQPTVLNEDDAAIVSAGSITISVAQGESLGAGSILADATSAFVAFDIAGELLLTHGDTDTPNAFTDLTAGGVTVENGGQFGTGAFLMQSQAATGGDLMIAGELDAGFGSRSVVSDLDYEENGSFDLTSTGVLQTGADLVVTGAARVVLAGTATIGDAIEVTGTGSTPMSVTLSGTLITGNLALSQFVPQIFETSLLTDVALVLAGGSMVLGNGAANASSALEVDAQSSFVVTGNASVGARDASDPTGGQGLDDQANTTVGIGATLSIATAFTIDNDNAAAVFTDNGSVLVTGPNGDLIVGAGSGLTGTGSYTIALGATLDVSASSGVMGLGVVNAVLNSGTIVFDPAGASVTYAPVSVDVTASSDFMFEGMGDSLQTALYTEATHSVAVVSGDGLTVDVVQNVTLEGVVADTALSVTTDGGNALVSLTLPCFAAGTLIRTTEGERPVERLCVGDRVVVVSDDEMAERAIVWIGDTVVDVAGHPQPERVAPIVVRAHAIAAGVPSRDLMVSPDHALLIAGQRMPARLLINGRSVTQDFDRDSVRYLHVELSAHSALIAEGLAAESYLDTGNRAAFADGEGAGEHDPARHAFAPLVTAAAKVGPIWRRIAERAGAGGIDATSDAALHLLVGDRTIAPSLIDGARHLFILPETATKVRLASRAAMPCQTRPWLDDRRRLGVAVRSIVQQDQDGFSVIGADHAALTEGWHSAERSGAVVWRWTDGDAVIPVGPRAHTIVVDLHATSEYPIAA